MIKEDVKHLGRFGEEIAAQYLMERGYKILKRNLRLLRTEIDLVAEKEGIIVFIEVKTRRTEHLGSGLEAVDIRKQIKLSHAATLFMSRGRLDQTMSCRFDVISIKINPTTMSPQHITHCQDAFR